MAQPTPYTRQYNFTDYQTTNPNDPLPAAQVDAELNAVKLTSDQTRTNLGLIQRDDGRLANQAVHKDAFDVTALALIGADGFNPRGAWAASTAYATQDLVDYNDATYVCLVAHTSSPAFPTDLTAGNWLLIANAAIGDVSSAVDYFEGDGTTTAFTLSYNYASTTGIQVYVNGVLQLPTDGAVTGDYTVSGTTLTFVSAPPVPAVAGRKNVVVWGANVTVQANVQAAQTAASNAQGYAAAAASSATAAAGSASAASTSATNAASSATSAAGSATTATNQATTATTQATNAANSATAAASSQSAAATSATNAAASQAAAATSATAAAASQSAAATSATNAASSATTATNQASTATTAATNASNSATAAATSASNASTSASQAATSASNSAGSASAANTSATNAASSATAAAGSASAASTSATNAAASQSAAATSASNAATSESNAATSATNAANSATAAATSASNAATSESNASASAVSAASSAASAAAILDNFDDRYLGAKASDPALDNDGNALIVGALYFNTTDGVMKIYTASGWIAASSASVATLTVYEFVATGGQTTFAGADANGNTLSYIAPALIVTLNGVRLRPGDDYTATDGVNIVLASGATVGDELVVDVFGNFLVSTAVSKAGDTMSGYLTLNDNPANALHAAPKQYVDTTATSKAVAFSIVFGG